MLKNGLRLSVVMVCVLILFGCPTLKKDFKLQIPFMYAESENYCAVACIQMWAWYDGNTFFTQDEIAQDLGAPTSLSMTEWGVNLFTNSIGWTEIRPASNYSQDLCITASVESYKQDCPSIMPFYGGQHGVLTTGYKYHDDQDGRPIADAMYYHDPMPGVGGAHLCLSAEVLKEGFYTPVQGYYYVIVGDRMFAASAVDAYDAFLDAGGTYYGGPTNYNPFVAEQ